MSLTLFTASNINHKLVKFATEKTVQAIPSSDLLIFSDIPVGIDRPHRYGNLPSSDSNEFKIVEYCDFMIKGLVDFVKTDHVLVYQYDGFAVNRPYWSDEFLNYDYIGTPTPYHTLYGAHGSIDVKGVDYTLLPGWFVGGGGFSLRSKKLLEALQDENISSFYKCRGRDESISYRPGDDVVISIVYREYLEQKHGIKFAPLEIAVRFASECATNCFNLGFHGWDNIPFYLTEDECLYYLDNLTKNDYTSNSVMLDKLIGKLYIHNYKDTIRYLYNKFNIEENNKELFR